MNFKMLKSNYKNNLITNSLVDLGDDIAIEGNGKGRHFTSRFIEAGVAHYEQFGDVLITKETLDKFIHSMVGCPVIIKHKDITDENADKERVGVVSRVWFNEFDGWYWCDGIIWDKQAIDLVKNQGWNVSCTYDFESDKQPKTHNGKKVDMEFTDGEFLHLALVPNPRYERANIVINSKNDVVENDRWITVKPNGEDEKGRHLLIKDGEDIGDAMRRQWGVEVKGQQHLFDRKKYKTDTNYKEELHKKLQEHLKTVQKRYDNLEYLGVAEPENLKDDDYEVISFEEWEDKQQSKEDNKPSDIKEEKSDKKEGDKSISEIWKDRWESVKKDDFYKIKDSDSADDILEKRKKLKDIIVKGHTVGGEKLDDKAKKYLNKIEQLDDSMFREQNRRLKANNSLLNGLDEILTNHTPEKEDLPILEGLKDILGE